MGLLSRCLPHYACGIVVKGFGRGSKTLGTPTANLEDAVIDKLPENFPTGIYYGWAQVNDGPVYPSVTSIGWNPYFKNQKKSMETYVMHEFDKDFYGATLRVCLVGYIRDEMDFTSIDDLKDAIQRDIDFSRSELEKPEHAKYRMEDFFSVSDSKLSKRHNGTNGVS